MRALPPDFMQFLCRRQPPVPHTRQRRGKSAPARTANRTGTGPSPRLPAPAERPPGRPAHGRCSSPTGCFRCCRRRPLPHGRLPTRNTGPRPPRGDRRAMRARCSQRQSGYCRCAGQSPAPSTPAGTDNRPPHPRRRTPASRSHRCTAGFRRCPGCPGG